MHAPRSTPWKLRRRTPNTRLYGFKVIIVLRRKKKKCHYTFKRNGYFRGCLYDADDPFGTVNGRCVVARGKKQFEWNGSWGNSGVGNIWETVFHAEKKIADAPGRFSTYYVRTGLGELSWVLIPSRTDFFSFSRRAFLQERKNYSVLLATLLKNAKYGIFFLVIPRKSRTAYGFRS